MIVTLEDLQTKQSEFRAQVSLYIKEKKSIRSIRYGKYLKGIVDYLDALIVLGMSVPEKTYLENLRHLYTTLAAWMHVVNNAAADRDKVFYIGIGERTHFSITA